MKKHWCLGLLGLIGFYKLPEVWSFFHDTGSAWALLNLLWFLWLDYLVPVKTNPQRTTPSD